MGTEVRCDGEQETLNGSHIGYPGNSEPVFTPNPARFRLSVRGAVVHAAQDFPDCQGSINSEALHLKECSVGHRHSNLDVLLNR
jgi:hypothetical protein